MTAAFAAVAADATTTCDRTNWPDVAIAVAFLGLVAFCAWVVR